MTHYEVKPINKATVDNPGKFPDLETPVIIINKGKLKNIYYSIINHLTTCNDIKKLVNENDKIDQAKEVGAQLIILASIINNNNVVKMKVKIKKGPTFKDKFKIFKLYVNEIFVSEKIYKNNITGDIKFLI